MVPSRPESSQAGPAFAPREMGPICSIFEGPPELLRPQSTGSQAATEEELDSHPPSGVITAVNSPAPHWPPGDLAVYSLTPSASMAKVIVLPATSPPPGSTTVQPSGIVSATVVAPRTFETARLTVTVCPGEYGEGLKDRSRPTRNPPPTSSATCQSSSSTALPPLGSRAPQAPGFALPCSWCILI